MMFDIEAINFASALKIDAHGGRGQGRHPFHKEHVIGQPDSLNTLICHMELISRNQVSYWLDC